MGTSTKRIVLAGVHAAGEKAVQSSPEEHQRQRDDRGAEQGEPKPEGQGQDSLSA
ncbi:MAG TPA: hypothetical protein VGU71_15485 [Candidatus Dormibacteraeota bacterium]|nr:hypothetical protein [Candidatus Dormibacteraeota bacterium]